MKYYKMRNEMYDQGLLDLINELPENIVMAEIGCYLGESTFLFSKSNKIKKIFAIDPWKPNYDDSFCSKSDMKIVEQIFDEKFIGNEKIIKMKMTLSEAFNELPPLDFIYIDGNHQYPFVVEDIKLAKNKVKTNGIISGHDYGSPKYPGVKKAVDMFFDKPDKVFKDKSWIKFLK